MTQPRQPSPRPPGERVGLIVTNLTKLAGIVVALNEALIEPELRSGGIAMAALMIAGAQAFESFLISFFGGGGNRSQ